MIRSFRTKVDASVYAGRIPKDYPPDLVKRARIKMELLDAAKALIDLEATPDTYLEALDGDRFGQHSIRLSNQWRVCFVWCEPDSYEVEIVNYH